MKRCMVPKSCHRTAGFSLLEVLIAVMILAISFIAALKGFYQAQDAGIRSQRLNTVSLLAQSKMDEILNDPFARDDGDFPDHPEIHWEVTRETVDLGLEDNFTLVRFHLSWGDSSRDQMTLERLLPLENTEQNGKSQ